MVMKHLKSFNEHLTYDEIDLDSFMNMYIVGRYFGSKEEAFNYLKSVLKNDDKKRNKKDFMVLDTEDGTLKPFKIYPKPNKKELNRKEASIFIKNNAYVKKVYPMVAYLPYSKLQEIKKLGIQYSFRPIQEIDFSWVLDEYYRGVIDNVNYVSVHQTDKLNNDSILMCNFPPKDSVGVKKTVSDIEKVLNDFNNELGTEYYIESKEFMMTPTSLKRKLKFELSDKTYDNYEYEYDTMKLYLKRYHKNEEEFLAIIPMDNLNKPIMKSE
jgi:hypothetical protein